MGQQLSGTLSNNHSRMNAATLPPVHAQASKSPRNAQLEEAYSDFVTAVRHDRDYTAQLSKLSGLDVPLEDKFKVLEYWSLITNNIKGQEDKRKLSMVFSILQKYGFNILFGQPDVYRKISLDSPVLRDKVVTIMGAKDVLLQFGYIEGTDNCLCYASVQPDLDQVARVTAECIYAQSELDRQASVTEQQERVAQQYMQTKSRVGTEHQWTSPGQSAAEAAPTKRPPSSEPDEEPICDICGVAPPEFRCGICDNKALCTACDAKWHLPTVRSSHHRSHYGSGRPVESTHAQAGVGQKKNANVVPQSASQENLRQMTTDELPNLPIFEGKDSNLEEIGRSQIQKLMSEPTEPTLKDLAKPARPQAKETDQISRVSKPVESSISISTPQRQKVQDSEETDYEKLFEVVRPPPDQFIPPEPRRYMQENRSLFPQHKTMQPNYYDPYRGLLPYHQSMTVQPNISPLFGGGVPTHDRPTRLSFSPNRTGSNESNPAYSPVGATGGYGAPHVLRQGSAHSPSNRPYLSSISPMSDENRDVFSPVPPYGMDPSVSPGSYYTSYQNKSVFSGSASNPPHYDPNPPFYYPRQTVEQQNFPTPYSSGSSYLNPTSPSYVGGDPSLRQALHTQKPPIAKKPAVTPFCDKCSTRGKPVLRESCSCNQNVLTSPSMYASLVSPTGYKCGSSVDQTGSRITEPTAPPELPPRTSAAAGRFPQLVRSSGDVTRTEQSPEKISDRFDKITISEADVVETKSAVTREQTYLTMKGVERGDIGFQPERPDLTPGQRTSESGAERSPRLEHFSRIPQESDLAEDKPAVNLERNDQARLHQSRDSLETIQQTIDMREMHTRGKELVRHIKAAGYEGYTVRHVIIALKHCGPSPPHEWLLERWDKLVMDVHIMGSNILRQENANLGIISLEEAKEALLKTEGDIQEASKTAAKKRKENIVELKSDAFDEKTIAEALKETGGDVQEARCQLIASLFLDTIWACDEPLTPKEENPYYNLNKPFNENFEKNVRNKDNDYERRVRMVLVKGKMQGWQRAENVIHILDSGISEEVTLPDIVEAVSNHGSLTRSRSFLEQECPICYTLYPHRMITIMNICQCKICMLCLQQNFEVKLRGGQVKDLVCPVCSEPDINNAEMFHMYFSWLNIALKPLLSRELIMLFEQKLTDWHLMQDPNFRWCSYSDCENGFIFYQQELKMRCEKCLRYTCFKCKKPWEDQHQGLTCEEFQTWKDDNDPETQAVGLARYLANNGIDCPQCNSRYALAKGGCIHFKCPRCGYEFCSGCNKPFKNNNCKTFKSCAKKGLHCHHPRDCLNFLRDDDVKDLQKLLQTNGIEYNNHYQKKEKKGAKCEVMEQKELPQGGCKDDPCGKPVPKDHAGLCSVHYKEYLVSLINKNNIDPVVVMDKHALRAELLRWNNEVPDQADEQPDEQQDEQYTGILRDLVRTNIPFKPRNQRPGY